MNELNPRDILERTFHGWPLVALGVLLGGLLGGLFSYLHPPVYEARAEILIHVDGALWAQEKKVDIIQEIELFNSYQPISDLLFSDEVLQGLMTAAQAEGIPLDRHTLLNTFSIQRVNLVWQMTVRQKDPATAARLADLWVESALPVYQAAHEHAITAHSGEIERLAIEKCFTEADFASGNACAGLSFASPADLETFLADLDTRIANARTAARGVDAALTLEAGAPASVPSAPVRNARTWLVLAGTLAGLMIGIAAALGLVPLRKKHGRAS
jgi:capsular polysaccharide biosynthesis protein